MTHGVGSPPKTAKKIVTPAQLAFQRNITSYLTLLPGGTEQDLNRHSLSRHTRTSLLNCFFVDRSGNLSLSVLQSWLDLHHFSRILFSPFIDAFLRLFPVGAKTPSWPTGTGNFKEVAAQALYPYCITSKMCSNDFFRKIKQEGGKGAILSFGGKRWFYMQRFHLQCFKGAYMTCMNLDM